MTTRPTGRLWHARPPGMPSVPDSGAGITGIGAGDRLKTRLPKRIQTTGQ